MSWGLPPFCQVLLTSPEAHKKSATYDAKGIATIASIPSREVLISKLLGSLQSPVTNFARVINQIAEKNGGNDAA